MCRALEITLQNNVNLFIPLQRVDDLLEMVANVTTLQSTDLSVECKTTLQCRLRELKME